MELPMPDTTPAPFAIIAARIFEMGAARAEALALGSPRTRYIADFTDRAMRVLNGDYYSAATEAFIKAIPVRDQLALDAGAAWDACERRVENVMAMNICFADAIYEIFDGPLTEQEEEIFCRMKAVKEEKV
jgi:hypothetical protein